MRYSKMRYSKFGPATLAFALGLGLAGCGGIPTNRSMTSVHQPVVEKVNYTLDVSASGSGLAYGEQQRLAGWFDAMAVKYGDKVHVDDPSGSPTTRGAIAAVAARYGLLLSDEAPMTDGYIPAGTARVVITRTKATVPGCPDWTSNSDFNPNNGLSSNYGCATNSNLAAMIANPEDLIRGADTPGSTVVMSSSKAIDVYRKATPTGAGGLKETSSKGD